MIIYVVKPGDTLSKISQQFNVPVARIVADNALSNKDTLVVGQSLLIRPISFNYTVQSNETLTEIARRFNTTVNNILAFNPQITSPNDIYPGLTIRIDYDNPNKRDIEVNGFVYPEVNLNLLRRVLPFLTYLSIFSYQITNEGLLNDINDTTLITEAYRYNVAPVMTVTNVSLEEQGTFSTELIHNILNDEQKRNTLLNDIVRVANLKNYFAICIDFEYLYPSDREAYDQFLRMARDRFEPLGYMLLTAVAPKNRRDQPGLLYEAHDYPAHGEIADHVIIMTYEWGYIFGPALPVAPINEVEKVIQYAITDIPHYKILMGIPNYGYDFKVPFVEGSMARLISNPEAIDIAIEKNAGIEFNETAQSPFFRYTENGQQHEVHFEDPRSITAKFRLVEKYDLRGVSYWTLMDPFPQNWLLLTYYFNIVKLL